MNCVRRGKPRRFLICGIFFQKTADTLVATEIATIRPRPAEKGGFILKRFKIALALGLLLAVVLTCSFSSFAAVCDEIRTDTLRLHILANSDSEADQQLKLAVRDAILAQEGELFSGSEDKQQALDRAAQQLSRIQQIAEETLREQGCDDPVHVRLTNLYFTTTRYPDTGLTLPAGRYDAVRVEIGEAAGKNWFCVLFPPLCLPAATEKENQYTEEEQMVTEGDYELRFALVEWVEQLREFW